MLEQQTELEVYLKLYGENMGTLKLNETIRVVGVLELIEESEIAEPATGLDSQLHGAKGNRMELHVVTYQKLDLKKLCKDTYERLAFDGKISEENIFSGA